MDRILQTLTSARAKVEQKPLVQLLSEAEEAIALAYVKNFGTEYYTEKTLRRRARIDLVHALVLAIENHNRFMLKGRTKNPFPKDPNDWQGLKTKYNIGGEEHLTAITEPFGKLRAVPPKMLQKIAEAIANDHRVFGDTP